MLHKQPSSSKLGEGMLGFRWACVLCMGQSMHCSNSRTSSVSALHALQSRSYGLSGPTGGGVCLAKLSIVASSSESGVARLILGLIRGISHGCHVLLALVYGFVQQGKSCQQHEPCHSS